MSKIPQKKIKKIKKTRGELLQYIENLWLRVNTADEPENNEVSILGKWKLKKNWEVELIKEEIPELLIPKTQSFDQYNVTPYFPVILKYIYAQRGEYKYVIDTPEQLNKLGRFFLDSSLDKRLNQRNSLRTGFDIQELIETPSERFTSYRILVTLNGDILATELYYSNKPNPSDIIQEDISIWDMRPSSNLFDYFVAPDSPVFLASRNVLSNRSQKGTGIVLNRNSWSKPINPEEEKILIAHGLDPKNPKLPEKLREQCSIIAKKLGLQRWVVMGIDFIQKVGTDDYYYLETNPWPWSGAFMDTYLDKYGGLSEEEIQIEMLKVALDKIIE